METKVSQESLQSRLSFFTTGSSFQATETILATGTTIWKPAFSTSSISFLDLFLYRDISSNVLNFSTFQKPLNKYLYIPFESFHPSSNKRAFIKGELMGYAKNSSSFTSFAETRQSD